TEPDRWSQLVDAKPWFPRRRELPTHRRVFARGEQLSAGRGRAAGRRQSDPDDFELPVERRPLAEDANLDGLFQTGITRELQPDRRQTRGPFFQSLSCKSRPRDYLDEIAYICGFPRQDQRNRSSPRTNRQRDERSIEQAALPTGDVDGFYRRDWRAPVLLDKEQFALPNNLADLVGGKLGNVAVQSSPPDL